MYHAPVVRSRLTRWIGPPANKSAVGFVFNCWVVLAEFFAHQHCKARCFCCRPGNDCRVRKHRLLFRTCQHACSAFVRLFSSVRRNRLVVRRIRKFVDVWKHLFEESPQRLDRSTSLPDGRGSLIEHEIGSLFLWTLGNYIQHNTNHQSLFI